VVLGLAQSTQKKCDVPCRSPPNCLLSSLPSASEFSVVPRVSRAVRSILFSNTYFTPPPYKQSRTCMPRFLIPSMFSRTRYAEFFSPPVCSLRAPLRITLSPFSLPVRAWLPQVAGVLSNCIDHKFANFRPLRPIFFLSRAVKSLVPPFCDSLSPIRTRLGSYSSLHKENSVFDHSRKPGGVALTERADYPFFLGPGERS